MGWVLSISSLSTTIGASSAKEKGRWRPISPEPFPDVPDTGFPGWAAGVLVRNRLLRCFQCWVYEHVGSAIGFFRERDGTFGERKQRMVLTHADIGAWMPLGAALTNDDVAGENALTAKLLHAKAL